MLFVGTVARFFWQVLVVVFPTSAQQVQPNRYLERPYSYQNCGLYLNYLFIYRNLEVGLSGFGTHEH